MANNETNLESSRNARARSSAQAAAERLTAGPTGIVKYVSRGRVLVIGGEPAQWLAARIVSPLHAELLLTEGSVEPGVPTVAQAGRPLTIGGHLGAFRIELGDRQRHNHELIESDLVIDLSTTALIDSELPPPGYWHFGTEPADQDNALLVLDGMVGTFEKPRYFDYDAAICAHARAGQSGCRQCIDACPADAIISIGEHIEVNPNLCQGGGICATVCPTGAIRYAYPPAIDTTERIRLLLSSYRQNGGSDPVVLFVAEADASDLPPLPSNVLLIVVEELASVGHEQWLAAIAWGASRVLLGNAGSVPRKSDHALRLQLEHCQRLLGGLGYPQQAVMYVDTAATVEVCGAVDGLPPAASFAAVDAKRQLAQLALDHLAQHSTVTPLRIALAAGAPYGEVVVDGERCTLCMSCTSVCPSAALNAGDEVPRLLFYEANCVQCGICERACPEQAITLQAGYLPDPDARRRARTLYEEPPFCCVSCGKPFATQRVIGNILEKLASHAMFQSERAKRRLQMCEDCRVIDAVQDAEAMQSGLFAGRSKTHNKGNPQ